MSPICLFTSIRPPTDAEDISYLTDCLRSWRAAGFDTVTINGPKEIEILRRLHLPISFSVMEADGKPRIGAFFSAIRERSCRFAGIINSDCRIVGYPNLAVNLQAGLEMTALLAWRLNVEDTAKPAAMRLGFDAYFFDAKIIPCDDYGFSIGDTWWDLWFPLACEMSGARLETLAVPMLTHKVHPLNWDEKNWIRGAHQFWAFFQNWYAGGTVPKSLLAKIPADWLTKNRLSQDQLGILSLIVPPWLHDNRPQVVSVLGAEATETERMLRLGGEAMLVRMQLADMQVQLAGMQAQLAGMQGQLANIQNSTSWRLTAPLRKMVDSIRHVRFNGFLAPSSSSESRTRKEAQHETAPQHGPVAESRAGGCGARTAISEGVRRSSTARS